jgi:hypothetical protein
MLPKRERQMTQPTDLNIFNEICDAWVRFVALGLLVDGQPVRTELTRRCKLGERRGSLLRSDNRS